MRSYTSVHCSLIFQSDQGYNQLLVQLLHFLHRCGIRIAVYLQNSFWLSQGSGLRLGAGLRLQRFAELANK